MEHEGSYPCSQEAATRHYAEPDESIPQLNSLFVCDSF
jgi:hypothetical protein